MACAVLTRLRWLSTTRSIEWDRGGTDGSTDSTLILLYVTLRHRQHEASDGRRCERPPHELGVPEARGLPQRKLHAAHRRAECSGKSGGGAHTDEVAPVRAVMKPLGRPHVALVVHPPQNWNFFSRQNFRADRSLYLIYTIILKRFHHGLPAQLMRVLASTVLAAATASVAAAGRLSRGVAPGAAALYPTDEGATWACLSNKAKVVRGAHRRAGRRSPTRLLLF